jgi:hypothetical protein
VDLDLLDQITAIFRLGHHFDVGGCLEHDPQALTYERMVVRENDANRAA